jgi:hypothetical protein
MIAGVPADKAITFFTSTRDDDDATLLKRMAGDARLPESHPSGSCRSQDDARGEAGGPAVAHAEGTVGLTARIGENPRRETQLSTESPGFLDCAVPHNDELCAERPDTLAVRRQFRDLLPAEQAPKVPHEYEHCAALGPKLAQQDLPAVWGEDSQAVEYMRHLYDSTERFLEAVAAAAARGESRTASQIDRALARGLRSQFIDSFDVDADEVLVIELRLQVVHRLAKQYDSSPTWQRT